MGAFPIEDINSKQVALATIKADDWITYAGEAIGKIDKITGNKIFVLFTPEALEPGGFRDSMYEYLGEDIAGFPIDDIIDRLSIDIIIEGHPHIKVFTEKLEVEEAPQQAQSDVVAIVMRNI